MKERFLEFLWKRTFEKMEDVREASSHEDVDHCLDELETYLNEIKLISFEEIKTDATGRPVDNN